MYSCCPGGVDFEWSWGFSCMGGYSRFTVPLGNVVVRWSTSYQGPHSATSILHQPGEDTSSLFDCSWSTLWQNSPASSRHLQTPLSANLLLMRADVIWQSSETIRYSGELSVATWQDTYFFNWETCAPTRFPKSFFNKTVTGDKNLYVIHGPLYLGGSFAAYLPTALLIG